MKVQLSVLAAGLGLCISALPILAHHSFAAEYDDKKPVTLQGTITKVFYPVFPPDRNAADVLAWLLEHRAS